MQLNVADAQTGSAIMIRKSVPREMTPKPDTVYQRFNYNSSKIFGDINFIIHFLHYVMEDNQLYLLKWFGNMFTFFPFRYLRHSFSETKIIAKVLQ